MLAALGNRFIKYGVPVCLLLSFILFMVAVSVYPGGSLADKNSTGFDWTKNFMSNLFLENALNGMENPSRNWAIPGMAFHSLAYGLFFLNMSKKMFNRHAAQVLMVVGLADVFFNFMIATSLHDLMITLSSTLSLLGLFYITVFMLKTKLHVLKVACLVCMLTFYFTLFLYGMGDWGLLAIMQKVSVISSVLLILCLEFFTRKEDFKPRT